MGKKKDRYTLIALDIQGKWNLPLLDNAAKISGASLQFCKSGEFSSLVAPTITSFSEISESFDTILACETGTKANNIFQYPAPRGNIALIVGNEKSGIPKSVLKQCTDVVTIPMYSRSLTSVNVAASASACLYIVQRDLARKGFKSVKQNLNGLDLAVKAPEDPAECGSIIRTAGAFGFRRIYLCDTCGSWFSDNKEIITLSRAAARREVNPIHVKSLEELSCYKYKRVVQFTQDRTGFPLSKYRLGDEQILIALGFDDLEPSFDDIPKDKVYVDFTDKHVQPKARHEACVALSVLSNRING